MTAILARRFSGARLVSTLRETDSPRRPTRGDAQLDGRGRSQARGADCPGGQSSPGCEPRCRRSRPDHRRLQRVLGTPGPACGRAVVSDELPMRIIAIDARGRRPRHAGIDAVSVSPGCGPLRRRLFGRSHPDTDRAPRRLAVDSCLRAAPAAATRQRLRRPPAHGRNSVRRFPRQTFSCLAATHQTCPPTPTRRPRTLSSATALTDAEHPRPRLRR